MLFETCHFYHFLVTLGWWDGLWQHVISPIRRRALPHLLWVCHNWRRVTWRVFVFGCSSWWCEPTKILSIMLDLCNVDVYIYIYTCVCVIKYAVLISKVVSSCKHVSWVSGRHAALGKRSALLLWELHSSRLCYGTQTWRCQWLDWCYEKTQGIPGRFQEII